MVGGGEMVGQLLGCMQGLLGQLIVAQAVIHATESHVGELHANRVAEGFQSL